MVPRKNPEVVWRLEKGIKEAIHQLNLVGAEIWTRINGINGGRPYARIFRLQWKKPGKKGMSLGIPSADMRAMGC